MQQEDERKRRRQAKQCGALRNGDSLPVRRTCERCEAVGRAEEDAKHTMNKCNNNNMQCSVNAT